LLRLIEKHISFAFVREKLKASYSDTGRPSIDPELLLRILLIGYLYGITSERKLVEELRMHLAWRWFTGLGFDQEIPHHSTFSKNRHGRFQESNLFEDMFEQIVRQCVEVGLVQGKHLSVDGSFVEANAAKESRIPREQLLEAAEVNHTVRQYVKELEQQNPVEEPVHQQDQVSTTDPDSTYATKGGTPARLGYYDNYLVDNQSCVIVGVQATAARMSQETVAAQDMLDRFARWQGREPVSGHSSLEFKLKPLLAELHALRTLAETTRYATELALQTDNLDELKFQYFLSALLDIFEDSVRVSNCGQLIEETIFKFVHRSIERREPEIRLKIK